MAKLCKYCGKKFEAKGRQTLCSDCRAAEGQYDEIYKAKKRKLKAERKCIQSYDRKKQDLDRRKCAKCLYRMHLSEGDTVWRCGYCYYTGHKRPCEISSDCTVYKTYSEKKRNQLVYELRNKV